MNAKNTKVKMTDSSQEQITKEFIGEFEKLMEKYKIEEYVFNCSINSGIILYKPDNIMEITKKLKIIHQQFFGRVMESCGETR